MKIYDLFNCNGLTNQRTENNERWNKQKQQKTVQSRQIKHGLNFQVEIEQRSAQKLITFVTNWIETVKNWKRLYRDHKAQKRNLTREVGKHSHALLTNSSC
jgi:hypothetical protein